MNTKKTVTVWHLRVAPALIEKVRKLAKAEQRSVTKQAQVLLERAVAEATNGSK